MAGLGALASFELVAGLIVAGAIASGLIGWRAYRSIDDVEWARLLLKIATGVFIAPWVLVAPFGLAGVVMVSERIFRPGRNDYDVFPVWISPVVGLGLLFVAYSLRTRRQDTHDGPP